MTNKCQYLFHAFNLWNQVTDSSQVKTTNRCLFVSNIPVESWEVSLAVDHSYCPLILTAAVTNTISGRLQLLAVNKCATVQNDTFSVECKPGPIPLAPLWIRSRTAAVRKVCNNPPRPVRLHTSINPAEGVPKSPCYQMRGSPILKKTRTSQRSNPQNSAGTSLQLQLFCSKLLG